MKKKSGQRSEQDSQANTSSVFLLYSFTFS